MYLYLGFSILLLAAESWVSMVEAAFFSVPALALERLKHELGTRSGAHLRRVALVERVLGQPAKLLGAILVADMLVSVTLSSVFALFAVSMAHHLEQPEALVLAVASVLLLMLLLVLGEVLPKLLAVRRPLRLALAFAPGVDLLFRMMAPVSGLLEQAATAALRRAKPQPFPTEAELATMLEIGKTRGVIVGQEGAILTNLMELDKRTVSEIMTPRKDAVALERTRSVREALELAQRVRHSRILVYDRTVDQVTGVFHVKDGFGVPDDSVEVGTVAREPYFTPEVKPVAALLDEFRKLGIHVAVVIDEFGQTAGIVTLEDVLEALVGEIRDEYDLVEDRPYFRMDDKTYVVDGEIDLRTLDRLFHHALRGQHFQRLSGFVHHQLGRIPEAGDSFRFKGLFFKIEQVTGNTIERVLVRQE